MGGANGTHAAVGRRYGLKGNTVSKMASQGKRIVLETMQRELDSGEDREKVIETMAKTINVNADVLRALIRHN